MQNVLKQSRRQYKLDSTGDNYTSRLDKLKVKITDQTPQSIVIDDLSQLDNDDQADNASKKSTSRNDPNYLYQGGRGMNGQGKSSNRKGQESQFKRDQKGRQLRSYQSLKNLNIEDEEDLKAQIDKRW